MMRRLETGLGNVAEMWIELFGLGQAGWPGVAAFATLFPLAILITPATFVAGVMRRPPES